MATPEVPFEVVIASPEEEGEVAKGVLPLARMGSAGNGNGNATMVFAQGRNRIHPTPLQPSRGDWLGPAKAKVHTPFAETDGRGESAQALQPPRPLHQDGGVEQQHERQQQVVLGEPAVDLDEAHLLLQQQEYARIKHNQEAHADLVLREAPPKLRPAEPAPQMWKPSELVQKGGMLWKVPCAAGSSVAGLVLSGGPKRRWFQVVVLTDAYATALLQWHDPEKSTRKARSIQLARVEKILCGRQTDAFFNLADEVLPPSDLCFSLLLPDRTLDLAANSPNDLRLWLEGLSVFAHGAAVVRSRESMTIKRAPDFAPPEMTMDQVIDSLFDACYEGVVNRFCDLLNEYDVDIDTPEPGVAKADSCLIIACKLGHVKVAETCLRFGANNDPHPDYGETALQAAVGAGHMVCAKLILETAAPSKMDVVIVNDTDHKGTAPLHVACTLKDLFLIQLLVRHGADLTLLDRKGRTVLHRVILASSKVATAAAGDRVQCLRFLIDAGGDNIINVQDDCGNTALHFAAQTGDLVLVRTLLESAGNPLIANNEHFQPYHIAISKQHTSCLKLLREYESWFQQGPRQAVEHLPPFPASGSTPMVWTQHYTEEGYEYFINEATGFSQWEDPRGVDHMAVVRAEGQSQSVNLTEHTPVQSGVGERVRRELYRARQAERRKTTSQSAPSGKTKGTARSKAPLKSQKKTTRRSGTWQPLEEVNDDDVSGSESQSSESEEYEDDDETFEQEEESKTVENLSLKKNNNNNQRKGKKASRPTRRRDRTGPAVQDHQDTHNDSDVSEQSIECIDLGTAGGTSSQSASHESSQTSADCTNPKKADTHEKYISMRQFGIGEAAVRQKMLMDGITDESIIAMVLKVQKRAAPPEAAKIASQVSNSAGRQTKKAGNNSTRDTDQDSPSGSQQTAEQAMEAFEALEVSAKYLRMKKMGIPAPAIKQKMLTDGVVAETVQLFEVAFNLVNPAKRPGVVQKKRSNRSLVKLHWSSLRVDDVENTVWAADDALPEDDLKDLEELFASKKPTKSICLGAKRAPEKPKRRSAVSSKRENNIGIGLSQFKRAFESHAKIAEAIEHADLDKLDSAKLSLLLDLLPAPDERRGIEAAVQACGSEEAFLKTATPVESFFHAICKVEKVGVKVQCLVFHVSFPEVHTKLMSQMRTVADASGQIQSSDRLKQVFKLILDIGNFMNDGDESGFTLDSLLKLGETRAADRKTTVMDYLCKLADRKGGEELLNFDQDLSEIAKASRLLPSDLARQVTKAAKELGDLLQVIDSFKGSPFAEAMRHNAEQIRPQLAVLEAMRDDMLSSTTKAIQYFGEAPSSCTPQHMLQVIDRFLQLFSKSRETFLRRKKAQERERERERLRRLQQQQQEQQQN